MNLSEPAARITKKQEQSRKETVELIMSKQKPIDIKKNTVVENNQLTQEEFSEWKKKHRWCGHCGRLDW